jgi:hypothetical protein
MEQNPVVVYRARNALEAEQIVQRLADLGIKALVANDLLESGRGVDAVGWATDARVVVGAGDAERARQLVLQFEHEQQGCGCNCSCGKQAEPVDMGRDWVWPLCPQCDSQRTTTCPGCGRSGTDFAPGDRPPHTSPEGAPAEDEAQVLICPSCDEPFVPQYLPRCEWCGHKFDAEPDEAATVAPGLDESSNGRILVVMALIVLFAIGGALYLWRLF